MMNETQIRELIKLCETYADYLKKFNYNQRTRNVYGMGPDQAADAFNEVMDTLALLKYLVSPVADTEADALVVKMDRLADSVASTAEIEKQVDAVTDEQVAAILFSRMRTNVRTAKRRTKADQN
jgi:hypothetical protein